MTVGLFIDCGLLCSCVCCCVGIFGFKLHYGWWCFVCLRIYVLLMIWIICLRVCLVRCYDYVCLLYDFGLV